MLHSWLKEYILLAFRIDKLCRKSGDYFIDSYFGPEDLSEIVKEEKNISVLIESAIKLKQILPEQNFEKQRCEFLKKQVQAMEMATRILNHENISLKQQVKSCLDIDIKWVPEGHFEHGIELFKEGLPGKGDLLNRFNNWNKRNEYSFTNTEQKKDIISLGIGEVRKRTKKIIELPQDEETSLEIVSGKKFGAANWYQGNYRSLVQFNADLPLNLFYLLNLASHELYPGHHTEFCMKEMNLLNNPEQQIYFIISPQLVISEGIAEIAFDMIFTPEEAAKWMIENIYKKLNIKTDDVNLAYLIRAIRMNSLDQIAGNVAIMLNDGCSQEQVKKYIKKFTLQSEVMINHVMNNLKKSIFKKIYAFSYFHGKNIIQNLLDKSGNKMVKFKRLLIEQVYPSSLV